MNVMDIVHYWEFGRGYGHTELSLRGIPKDERFIYVVLHNAQRIEMQRRFPKANIITIQEGHERLYSQSLPLIVDHAAMAKLILDARERLLNIGRNRNNE